MGSITQLPDSDSPDLYLSHPTQNECLQIWTNTFASWKDSFDLSMHLKESEFMTTVPLAKDSGMTIWALVDKNLAPDQRQILCSCESIRKRSLTSDSDGKIEESTIHGIASVFCPEEFRGRGYAARLMREMAKVLRLWQSEHGKCVGSILYSDIGKSYYARLGWEPNVNNSHIVLSPSIWGWPILVRPVFEENLPELCHRDETMVREALAVADDTVKKRVTIIPDLDHMLWHIKKAEFAAQHIFGRKPPNKGAIDGIAGEEVWAIWTHRYYEHPATKNGENVLYILRLVVEGDETANKSKSYNSTKPTMATNNELVASLKGVLQAARTEAVLWHLDHIKLWDPSPLVRSLIAQSGLDYIEVERQETSIASGLWYGEGEAIDEAPAWINNEHYAWC